MPGPFWLRAGTLVAKGNEHSAEHRVKGISRGDIDSRMHWDCELGKKNTCEADSGFGRDGLQ